MSWYIDIKGEGLFYCLYYGKCLVGKRMYLNILVKGEKIWMK